mmetsp:Transcript_25038/g.72281  ORF Transcript_25038/g.72281 Transcript_25038/m.72281 type:complete len:97 (-) Transcript_25038:302-592(-)
MEGVCVGVTDGKCAIDERRERHDARTGWLIGTQLESDGWMDGWVRDEPTDAYVNCVSIEWMDSYESTRPSLRPGLMSSVSISSPSPFREGTNHAMQ